MVRLGQIPRGTYVRLGGKRVRFRLGAIEAFEAGGGCKDARSE
jgi:hypothetical protein